jgi:hypothetical protein
LTGVVIVSYRWDGKSNSRLVQIFEAKHPNHTIESLFPQERYDEASIKGTPIQISKPKAGKDLFVRLMRQDTEILMRSNQDRDTTLRVVASLHPID